MNALNTYSFQRDRRTQSTDDPVSTETYLYETYSGGPRNIRSRIREEHNYESISNNEEDNFRDDATNWFSLCFRRERQ